MNLVSGLREQDFDSGSEKLNRVLRFGVKFGIDRNTGYERLALNWYFLDPKILRNCAFSDLVSTFFTVGFGSELNY